MLSKLRAINSENRGYINDKFRYKIIKTSLTIVLAVLTISSQANNCDYNITTCLGLATSIAVVLNLSSVLSKPIQE